FTAKIKQYYFQLRPDIPIFKCFAHLTSCRRAYLTVITRFQYAFEGVQKFVTRFQCFFGHHPMKCIYGKMSNGSTTKPLKLLSSYRSFRHFLLPVALLFPCVNALLFNSYLTNCGYSPNHFTAVPYISRSSGLMEI